MALYACFCILKGECAVPDMLASQTGFFGLSELAMSSLPAFKESLWPSSKRQSRQVFGSSQVQTV
jgi:hypothetical protein